MAFHPHTTHCLQPLDRSLFGSLKKSYDRQSSKDMNKDPNNTIVTCKWTFPGRLKIQWDDAVTPKNVKSGFKACGIYILNPGAIPDYVYKP